MTPAALPLLPLAEIAAKVRSCPILDQFWMILRFHMLRERAIWEHFDRLNSTQKASDLQVLVSRAASMPRSGKPDWAQASAEAAVKPPNYSIV